MARNTVFERVTYTAFGSPVFRSPANAILRDGLGRFVAESGFAVAELWRGQRYGPETSQSSTVLESDVPGLYEPGPGLRPLSFLPEDTDEVIVAALSSSALRGRTARPHSVVVHPELDDEVLVLFSAVRPRRAGRMPAGSLHGRQGGRG